MAKKVYILKEKEYTQFVAIRDDIERFLMSINEDCTMQELSITLHTLAEEIKLLRSEETKRRTTRDTAEKETKAVFANALPRICKALRIEDTPSVEIILERINYLFSKKEPQDISVEHKLYPFFPEDTDGNKKQKTGN